MDARQLAHCASRLAFGILFGLIFAIGFELFARKHPVVPLIVQIVFLGLIGPVAALVFSYYTTQALRAFRVGLGAANPQSAIRNHSTLICKPSPLTPLHDLR